MGKKIAIVQSNYIPWKGYFDLIDSVDEFILYDDAQYTRRDWRNRNKIKTARGTIWLTIPVQVRGKYFQKIKDTVISDPNWQQSHWKSIVHHYSSASYFYDYKEVFEELYLTCQETHLSQINYRFLTTICTLLSIDTRLSWTMDYQLKADIVGKTEKLIQLCKAANADEYLSGPSAKDYIDQTLFERENIKVSYMNYSGYPEYDQLFPPFEPSVSIIDLIFNQGSSARKYIKSF